MNGIICCCLPLLVGAGLMSQPALPVAGAPPAESQAAATTQPARRPLVSLSAAPYPEGVADEAAYQQYLDRTTTELAVAAEGADDPLDAAEGHLAAANWILARQVEPAVSRLLLGIEQPDDGATLRSSVARAQAELAACQVWLGATPQGDEPAPPALDTARRQEPAVPALDTARRQDPAVAAPGGPDESGGPSRFGGQAAADSRSALERLLGDLSAFAEALSVAWSDADGEDFVLRGRQAASALGILLEDDRPGVAATAALYQALLYRQTAQIERALAVLDLALKPLPSGGEPAAFLARLLRCRLLAQQGGYAVAWSLLLRLEERAGEWFAADEAGEEAARAVALLRLEVAEAWGKSLEQAGAPDEAAWCRRAAETIRGNLAEGAAPKPVMRLPASVPILLDEKLFSLDESPNEDG